MGLALLGCQREYLICPAILQTRIYELILGLKWFNQECKSGAIEHANQHGRITVPDLCQLYWRLNDINNTFLAHSFWTSTASD